MGLAATREIQDRSTGPWGTCGVIAQTRGARVARKTSILIGIALALTGSVATLLTLHVYARPHALSRADFRILGFPRNHRQL
jgi:hypothetical protein